MYREFIPKSYLYLRSGYSTGTLKKDLIAGITIGVIALPLAMAFAIASNASPEQGLITAIIAGFLISAFGGSRVQIGGPTAAFVGLVYSIIQRNGYEALATSMLIAAVLLVLFGLFRLGSWIKYVPHPLVMGFTTGIALIIFSTQIKDLFGLDMGTPPADFVAKWRAYALALPSLHWPTATLGGGSLITILFIRKYMPKLPWGIAAIVLATLCVYFLQLPVETIHSKFGQIPSRLPFPSFPHLGIPAGKFTEVFMDGVAIAFLAGIESLLSAVIGDGMIGGRHRSNCELIGQGIANFGSLLFGGLPATGAIARTAANVKTGAQTPVAGMIHALTLLLIVYFLAPIVSQIPLAALSAVLIVVAWNIGEFRHFFHLFRAPMGDVAILLTAFLLTVFVDITAAISLGMILSSFLFMKRMSQFSKTVPLTTAFHEPSVEFPDRSDPEGINHKTVPPGVEVYEIQGPFFYGAADMLKDLLSDLELPPKVFILRLRNALFIDASGMNALLEFSQKCSREKTILILCEIHGQTSKDFKRFGLIETIGKDRIFKTIDEALREANHLNARSLSP
ncbi:MAG: sulfate permease [Chlamydiota bacterium]